MLTSTPVPILHRCGHIHARPFTLRHGVYNLPCLLEMFEYVGENRDCPDCDPPRDWRKRVSE